ncbi:MAG: polysaccharide pyruvyl transferase family protein [Verrucomicrobia bacterium]|nr:polysaccharide pyruvyl transferase family protein [Verrucomicrobiota bacterium]
MRQHLKIFSLLALQILAFRLDASEETAAKEIPLFYWDARPKLGFSNFGDALSEAIIERVLGHGIPITNDPSCARQKLLGIGSIMHYAQDNDIVWGTGVNGTASAQSYRFTQLDVRAVRGPLSREFLLKRGIACPEVYGDPTLLFPLLFPEFQKPADPQYEFIVIPHFSDEALFKDCPNMVSVKEHWSVVVQKILNSKFVISSALSGIIIAEAFGIPARLLQIDNKSNTEDLFKYTDYYLGTNRSKFQFATSIEQALEMGGEPLPVCDLEALKNSFPFDKVQ